MARKLTKLRNLFIISTPIVFLVATSCGVSQTNEGEKEGQKPTTSQQMSAKIADKLGSSLSFDVNGNYVFTIKNDKFKNATEVVAHFEGKSDDPAITKLMTPEVNASINNSTATFNTAGKLLNDYKWSLKKIKVGSEEISQDQFPDDLKGDVWFEKKIAIVKQDAALWIDPQIQLLKNWINTNANVELKAEFIKNDESKARKVVDTTFNSSLNKFRADLQDGYKFNRILIQSKNNSFATISLPYKPLEQKENTPQQMSAKIADKLGSSLSFDVNGNHVFTIKNDKFKGATEVVAHFEGKSDDPAITKLMTPEVNANINNSTATFNTAGKWQYDYKWSLKKIKVVKNGSSEEISQDQFPDDLKGDIWFEKKIAIVKQDSALWIDPQIQLLKNLINTDANVELKAEFIKTAEPKDRKVVDTTFNSLLNKFRADLQEGYKFNRILIQSKNNSFATISLPYKPF
ncbi:hypothetical protein Q4497_00745 [Mesomycoplasma ovipneumoniae]|uniref:Lipoprotein associated domain n=1 Tax=Mesomycoplasma ovipneumoniae TaxID=29562 RepID=A0AAW6Q5Q6_9BACT|nr:hypothetical protein [Mesomycoplasma ovipneumoniae]MDF9627925.1 hypothetical protein [Mesomycoplasma ovipneumoniae]MDO4157549.1 hypothetical protein [Mesomycoplasma ovipneumoniae]MDO4158636.1 hypothetical protein [Mesomycoplasma ovipneumoniae]MDO6821556.1 hypothetical protein [Mesomycoplasma ovipneumoniae]MDO6856015.1 hypothetical protein [Mesomycoplasma ovipneumoniae]